MPRIYDLADILTPAELARFRNTPEYRAMNARDAGEFIDHQRRFLRTVIGVKWRWKCAYCGRRLVARHRLATMREWISDVHEWSDDHVVPKTEGGQYRANNIVPACRDCNTKRGHRPVDEFLRSIGMSTSQIAAWHDRRLFNRIAEQIIDDSLHSIAKGRRFTNRDVEWMQSLGDPKIHAEFATMLRPRSRITNSA